MDFHIITPKGAELVMRVVDGVLEVVPPSAPPSDPPDNVEIITEIQL